MTGRATEGSADAAACRVPAGGGDRVLPGCGTGPAGRLRFVVRELAGIARGTRLRNHEGDESSTGAGGDDGHGGAS